MGQGFLACLAAAGWKARTTSFSTGPAKAYQRSQPKQRSSRQRYGKEPFRSPTTFGLHLYRPVPGRRPVNLHVLQLVVIGVAGHDVGIGENVGAAKEGVGGGGDEVVIDAGEGPVGALAAVEVNMRFDRLPITA